MSIVHRRLNRHNTDEKSAAESALLDHLAQYGLADKYLDPHHSLMSAARENSYLGEMDATGKFTPAQRLNGRGPR